MLVKFLKDKYSAKAGMVEDYPKATAKRLIDEGVAVEFKHSKSAEAPSLRKNKPSKSFKRK